MGRIVLVCGGRDFADVNLLWSTLDKMHAESPIWLVVNGGASGADRLSSDWAHARDLCVHHYPVSREAWKSWGKAAGPMRNRQMLDTEHPHIVVAFPGGRGTADMVRQARTRNVEVVEVSR